MLLIIYFNCLFEFTLGSRSIFEPESIDMIWCYCFHSLWRHNLCDVIALSTNHLTPFLFWYSLLDSHGGLQSWWHRGLQSRAFILLTQSNHKTTHLVYTKIFEEWKVINTTRTRSIYIIELYIKLAWKWRELSCL